MQPRTIIKHDSVFVERQKVDSVYLRDSVFVREKGDTVYIYKNRLHYKYRYLRDTVAVVQRDTVKLTVIKAVDKDLTWWQTFRLKWFGTICTMLMAAIAWIFRKPLIKIIKGFLP